MENVNIVCLWCGKINSNGFCCKDHENKMSALWNKRVKEKKCLTCGKKLSKKDKTFDKNERKDCMDCLTEKKAKIKRLWKILEEAKRRMKNGKP